MQVRVISVQGRPDDIAYTVGIRIPILVTENILIRSLPNVAELSLEKKVDRIKERDTFVMAIHSVTLSVSNTQAHCASLRKSGGTMPRLLSVRISAKRYILGLQ